MIEGEPVMTIAGVPVYVDANAPQHGFDLGAQPSPSWFCVRPATPAELPAVLEAWSGTFKRSQSAGCVPNHLFDSVQLACMTGLLQRGARVSVLTARAAPDTVLAWVCHEADKRSDKPLVHYAFTRDGFRQRGYCGLLLAYIGAVGRFLYTHQTSFAKYLKGGYHNPGPARRKAL